MTEINRLGLNPSIITNNNEPKTKSEAKPEEQQQAAPQAQAETHSVAPEDVLSYMAQAAAVARAAITPQQQKPTPVAEFMASMVGATVEGLKEFSTADKLERAEAYKAANPGVEERMDGWMQALEDEIGAMFA